MRLFSLTAVLLVLVSTDALAQDTPPHCDVCWQNKYLTHNSTWTVKTWVTAGQRYDFLLFRESTSGDPDLYTNDSSDISTTNFDCAPWLGGSSVEHCVFEPTTSGYHYLMVHAYSGPVTYSVYVVESDAGCHTGNPGNSGYCSDSCTCGWELGHCASDTNCADGLTCVPNVGAEYGWGSGVGVCRGG